LAFEEKVRTRRAVWQEKKGLGEVRQVEQVLVGVTGTRGLVLCGGRGNCVPEKKMVEERIEEKSLGQGSAGKKGVPGI